MRVQCFSFKILIYIRFSLPLQAPSAAAARRGSSGRPSCCPLLFERASPSRWWAPQFDSSFLETQYWRSSLPRTTRKFQFGLMYLLGLCVMLAVYFPVTGTEKWPTYLGVFINNAVHFSSALQNADANLTALFSRNAFLACFTCLLLTYHKNFFSLGNFQG